MNKEPNDDAKVLSDEELEGVVGGCKSIVGSDDMRGVNFFARRLHGVPLTPQAAIW